MATTLTKVKPKAAAPAPKLEPVETIELPEHLDDGALADQYGDLKSRIEALMENPIFGLMKMCDEEMKKRMDQYEPTDELVMQGAKWRLDISACKKSPRKITDVLAVAQFIGTEAFAKIAKVGVSDAEKYLTPDQFVKVVSEEEYSANRAIKPTKVGGL